MPEIYMAMGIATFLYVAKIIIFHLLGTIPVLGAIFVWLHSTTYGLAFIDLGMGALIGHTFSISSVFGMVALCTFSIISVTYICCVLLIRKVKRRWKFASIQPISSGKRQVIYQ